MESSIWHQIMPDYNLIRCELRTGRLEEGTSNPRLKWKVEWEEYQQLVSEEGTWEEYMEVLWMGKDRESLQQI